MTVLPDTHSNQGNSSRSWIIFSNVFIDWCTFSVFQIKAAIKNAVTPELSIPETVLENSASSKSTLRTQSSLT